MFVKAGRDEAFQDLAELISKYEVPPKTLADPDNQETIDFWVNATIGIKQLTEKHQDALIKQLAYAWFDFMSESAAKRIKKAKLENA